mmetsp:Transcript_27399/g.78860  ORF Transcript_27399/g.78860 Transcript_27399/m.78860 type:complete len:90 (-) Transcript_27399:404-673(-)
MYVTDGTSIDKCTNYDPAMTKKLPLAPIHGSHAHTFIFIHRARRGGMGGGRGGARRGGAGHTHVILTVIVPTYKPGRQPIHHPSIHPCE